MKSYVPFVLVLIVALVLAGLGFYADRSGYFEKAADTEAITGPAAQAAETLEPTSEATAESTSEPTQIAEAPTDAPTPQGEENCLNCHTDAETLKVLAVEEEAGESLSSGEG